MEVNKNNHPKIDAVFQKTSERSPGDLEDEALAMWDNGFKQKVVKQNFFTFGLRRLNVYTLSGAILMIASLFLLLFNVSKSNTEELKNGDRTILVDTSGNNNPEEMDQRGMSRDTKNKDKGITSDKNKKNTSLNLQGTNVIIQPDTIIRSTSPSIQTNEALTATPGKHVPAESSTSSENKINISKDSLVKKEKKVIYLEKADTVRVIDTIRSKRAWKKLNKNK